MSCKGAKSVWCYARAVGVEKREEKQEGMQVLRVPNGCLGHAAGEKIFSEWQIQ